MHAREVTAKDLERFKAKIVRGPGSRDCAIWTGAIADDGYGRFSLRRAGRQLTVSSHRLAYALAYDVSLDVTPWWSTLCATTQFA